MSMIRPVKPKLIVGQHYMVEIKVGPSPRAVPTSRFLVKMRLVEKQANGVAVMEREAWRLLDPPFRGLVTHRYEPAFELVKIKTQQIKAAA